MGLELTNEQIALKKEIIHWYNNYGSGKPYYYYSGAAGTGKTTVIHNVIDELHLEREQYIACAYVGKAVLVLMRHGLPASTIHSLIYRPSFKKTEEIVFDSFGNPKKVKKRKMVFELKKHLNKNLKLIIVDECAMVNDSMRNDILSFGIPVIMTGDHNQLPPVIGKSSILDDPDFILTKIMRQAENDPIVYLSQCILNHVPIQYGIYGNSKVIPNCTFDNSILTDYDMVICAKNKTRDSLNDKIREELLHYEYRKPTIGDKVICRKNDWQESIDGIYLTNGLIGFIRDIDYCSAHRNILYADFQPDFMEKTFDKLSLDYDYFKMSSYDKKNLGNKFNDLEKFEFAYAITAHLSQGSEYSRVLFIDEKFHDPTTLNKLRYTAITRAMESVTYVKMHDERRYYNYNGYKYSID